MKSFGEIVKEKRIKAGLSVRQMAKKLGVTTTSIYYWQNNLVYPNIMIACDIADLFNCSLDELCGRDPTKITVKESKYERYKKYFS